MVDLRADYTTGAVSFSGFEGNIGVSKTVHY